MWPKPNHPGIRFFKNGPPFLRFQVQRESRLRQTRPGSPWSAEEHAADAEQSLRFLETGEVLNRKAKEAKKVEEVLLRLSLLLLLLDYLLAQLFQFFLTNWRLIVAEKRCCVCKWFV